MKNLFESIAVILVILLSLGIVFLIVEYNMIEDISIDSSTYTLPMETKVSKKKSNNYLKTLEGYTDVESEVDSRVEDTMNRVMVKSVNGANDIEKAVKDNYVNDLERYEEETKGSDVSLEKPVEIKGDDKLPKVEVVVDKVGMAIDAAINE